MTRLTAHFTYGLISALVIRKQRKECTECPYWNQVSWNNTNSFHICMPSLSISVCVRLALKNKTSARVDRAAVLAQSSLLSEFMSSVACSLYHRCMLQIGFKNQTGVAKEPLTKEKAAALIKDVFISAAERDIYTGDAIVLNTITKEGVKVEKFPLRRD